MISAMQPGFVALKGIDPKLEITDVRKSMLEGSLEQLDPASDDDLPGIVIGKDLATQVGALLGVACWALVDAWRGYRVRSWLKQGDLEFAPQVSGWWGLLLDRARRLLRERERALQNSDQRLRDFLSAIQNDF